KIHQRTWRFLCALKSTMAKVARRSCLFCGRITTFHYFPEKSASLPQRIEWRTWEALPRRLKQVAGTRNKNHDSLKSIMTGALRNPLVLMPTYRMPAANHIPPTVFARPLRFHQINAQNAKPINGRTASLSHWVL